MLDVDLGSLAAIAKWRDDQTWKAQVGATAPKMMRYLQAGDYDGLDKYFSDIDAHVAQTGELPRPETLAAWKPFADIVAQRRALNKAKPAMRSLYETTTPGLLQGATPSNEQLFLGQGEGSVDQPTDAGTADSQIAVDRLRAAAGAREQGGAIGYAPGRSGENPMPPPGSDTYGPTLRAGVPPVPETPQSVAAAAMPGLARGATVLPRTVTRPRDTVEGDVTRPSTGDEALNAFIKIIAEQDPMIADYLKAHGIGQLIESKMKEERATAREFKPFPVSVEGRGQIIYDPRTRQAIDPQSGQVITDPEANRAGFIEYARRLASAKEQGIVDVKGPEVKPRAEAGNFYWDAPSGGFKDVPEGEVGGKPMPFSVENNAAKQILQPLVPGRPLTARLANALIADDPSLMPKITALAAQLGGVVAFEHGKGQGYGSNLAAYEMSAMGDPKAQGRVHPVTLQHPPANMSEKAADAAGYVTHSKEEQDAALEIDHGVDVAKRMMLHIAEFNFPLNGVGITAAKAIGGRQAELAAQISRDQTDMGSLARGKLNRLTQMEWKTIKGAYGADGEWIPTSKEAALQVLRTQLQDWSNTRMRVMGAPEGMLPGATATPVPILDLSKKKRDAAPSVVPGTP